MADEQSVAERSLASYREALAARDISIDNLNPSSAYEQGHMAGAREEREAVTGWLNSWASHLAAHPHKTDVELIWWISSQIEAGECRE